MCSFMNLRHLEIFYLVMLFGSLTEAASSLCISQPAASKLLKHASNGLVLLYLNGSKENYSPPKKPILCMMKLSQFMKK